MMEYDSVYIHWLLAVDRSGAGQQAMRAGMRDAVRLALSCGVWGREGGG
jgi:hypothetical protein